MNINTIYNCNFLANGLPDRCADLIIADPPYYRVKGDFDFGAWPSFEAYLAEVAKWANECARLLSPQGTLLWYGFHTTIAHSQVILDRLFKLLNNAVLAPVNGFTHFASADAQRAFLPNVERLLVYASLEEYKEGMLHARLVKPVIDYLVQERDRAGHTSQSVNDALHTQNAYHWFSYTSRHRRPTREAYNRLRDLFNAPGGDYLRKEYDDLRKEYDDLRKEYDDLRRPFNNSKRLTDILTYTIHTHDSSTYHHPTCKNEMLTQQLITICSRPGQLVVAPFAGSGTECAMAKLLGRQYVGYEINKEYAEAANRRCRHTSPLIFSE